MLKTRSPFLREQVHGILFKITLYIKLRNGAISHSTKQRLYRIFFFYNKLQLNNANKYWAKEMNCKMSASLKWTPWLGFWQCSFAKKEFIKPPVSFQENLYLMHIDFFFFSKLQCYLPLFIPVVWERIQPISILTPGGSSGILCCLKCYIWAFCRFRY